ncbi:patatin-like phospholipase family protein [bacterium]|nr:patatin-like phospholipase family protein [bacterium]
MINFKTIVLAGGGTKGIIELGVLHYYFEKKACEQVEIYSGVSIGSIICLLLICGYTPIEIFHEVYESGPMFDKNDVQPIKEMISTTGILSMDRFKKKIEILVKNKLGKIPTLKELHDQTKKTFIITLSNVTSMQSEYFSYKTHPLIDCVTATVMSCNIPGIFHKMSYKGNFYVDGGLKDNFPIKYTIETEETEKILGVVITGTDTSLSDKDFLGYLYRLIFMPINTITDLRSDQASEDKNITLIKIEWNGSSLSVTSDISKSSQLEMFGIGYQKCEKYEFESSIEKENLPEEKLIPNQSSIKTNVKCRKKK